VLELRAGSAVVVVDERHGGRLERLLVAGRDLLVPPDVDDHNYGAFPMAPWAGRIRHGRFRFDGVDYELPCNKPPHAIHGIARDRRWRVDDTGPAAATLSVALDAPWPFGGRVVQHVALATDALHLTMEVHAADRPMPATCGWHPWWNRIPTPTTAPLEVELHADAMYRRDDEDIPTGEVVPISPPPWDDCFTRLGTPAAVLRWPDAETATLDTDCPCLVVFTEPEHAICVEPQSGPPDAFNLDLDPPPVVTPDAPLVVHATVRWSGPTGA
jgi:galactose mutarotase-like enzyme